MPTILISAPYMMPSISRFTGILEHYGCKPMVADVNERLSEEEILAYAGQFDGVICGDDRFTPRVMDACLPRLKVISKWGTGIDSIDKPYGEKVGITVRNTTNAFTLPVSDTVMGLMLSFARGIPWMNRDVKKGSVVKIPRPIIERMHPGCDWGGEYRQGGHSPGAWLWHEDPGK